MFTRVNNDVFYFSKFDHFLSLVDFPREIRIHLLVKMADIE